MGFLHRGRGIRFTRYLKTFFKEAEKYRGTKWGKCIYIYFFKVKVIGNMHLLIFSAKSGVSLKNRIFVLNLN